ncbi:hypothetical protein GWK08_18855 [Leptobacterium flavescens]|uniref:NRDE family protein n=1 Tax=Leptobacterium flavescens TaxID=472055 RepID=A0A6P0USJ4_9FLAO|nr:NRDE family protein [Leptobacterium flavescens]NER15522.1 hypothetical protein [Leptobacterium flavescens]
MCTVSYISHNNGFTLTSNRDEDPLRKTLAPQKLTNIEGQTVVAPIDEENNGTWIAASDGRVACLLNGAFVKHQRNLPYRKSRGLIVLEAFEHSSFSDFVEEVDLHNIEPFTLVLAEKGKLQVLIWDETTKHHEVLDHTKSHLWSSSTLYTRDAHKIKLNFFNNFISEGNLGSEKILDLHGLNDDNLFILNRPKVRTVSITQFVSDSEEINLDYNLKRESVSA